MVAPVNLSRVCYESTENLSEFAKNVVEVSCELDICEHLIYWNYNLLLGTAGLIYCSFKAIYRVAELTYRTTKTIFVFIGLLFTFGQNKEIRFCFRGCLILNLNSLKRVFLFIPQIGSHLAGMVIGLIPFSASIAAPFLKFSLSADRESDNHDATLQEDLWKDEQKIRIKWQREAEERAQADAVRKQQRAGQGVEGVQNHHQGNNRPQQPVPPNVPQYAGEGVVQPVDHAQPGGEAGPG